MNATKRTPAGLATARVARGRRALVTAAGAIVGHVAREDGAWEWEVWTDREVEEGTCRYLDFAVEDASAAFDRMTRVAESAAA